MNQEILKKLPHENEAQYIFRIGQAKDNGLITDTWGTISPILNKELGYDEEDWKGESAWRKRYRNYLEAYEEIFSKSQFSKSRLDEMKETQKELFKAKKQFEDQRRECKKIWTQEARFDNLTDKLIESVNRICDEQPLEFYDHVPTLGNKEAVLCLADWHYGMVTDNIWNKYNTGICRQRVSQLIFKTIEYLQLHNVNTLHITWRCSPWCITYKL